MGRIFLSQRLGIRATAGMPTAHASEARERLDGLVPVLPRARGRSGRGGRREGAGDPGAVRRDEVRGDGGDAVALCRCRGGHALLEADLSAGGVHGGLEDPARQCQAHHPRTGAARDPPGARRREGEQGNGLRVFAAPRDRPGRGGRVTGCLWCMRSPQPGLWCMKRDFVTHKSVRDYSVIHNAGPAGPGT